MKAIILLNILAVSLAFSDSAPEPERKEKKIFISNRDLAKRVLDHAPEFPKYTTQIINLANQNAQATRPRHVGQMSELIQAFPGDTYEEWLEFYESRHPEGIDAATAKIMIMLDKMKDATGQIDQTLVRTWVRDLILTKTYLGLTYQEGILRTLAAKKETTWRLAKPEEEARGVDGMVGDIPISVKPTSYHSKAMLNETIDARIVYYEKAKGGIRVFYDF